MKEDPDLPVYFYDDTPWRIVVEEKKEKERRSIACGLAALSLILSIYAVPMVGTRLGTPLSEILQAYVFGVISCLFAYFSLRTRFTLIGLAVFLWSGWMFYPTLQQVVRIRSTCEWIESVPAINFTRDASQE